jgi:hypothetical protein
MRATKKRIAGIVAATTIGAAILYRFRRSTNEETSAESDTEAAA